MVGSDLQKFTRPARRERASDGVGSPEHVDSARSAERTDPERIGFSVARASFNLPEHRQGHWISYLLSTGNHGSLRVRGNGREQDVQQGRIVGRHQRDALPLAQLMRSPWSCRKSR